MDLLSINPVFFLHCLFQHFCHIFKMTIYFYFSDLFKLYTPHMWLALAIISYYCHFVADKIENLLFLSRNLLNLSFCFTVIFVVQRTNLNLMSKLAFCLKSHCCFKAKWFSQIANIVFKWSKWLC